MGESNFSARPDKETKAPINVNQMTRPMPHAASASQTQKKKTTVVLWAVLASFLLLALCVGTVFTSYLLAGVIAQRRAQEEMATFQPKQEITVINQNSTVVENTGNTYSEEDRVIAVRRVEESVVSVHLYLSKEEGTADPEAYYSAGSGVVWSGTAQNNQSATVSFIVTNYHVIESYVNGVATYITVTTTAGASAVYEATLVGGDLFSDLAVLKIDKALPQAEKSSNAEIQTGMSCIAVGNPLGIYGGTVTSGNISALARDITLEGITQTLLQFDAAVNSGNSGGGLFDYNGRLLGIVNAKSMGEGIEGLGFAIPIDTVKTVVGQLITQGYVTGRPQMGVTLLSISQETVLTGLESSFPGMTDHLFAMEGTKIGVYGLYVTASQHSALQFGDYLYSINGTRVSDMTDVRRILSQSAVGDLLTLELVRTSKSNAYYYSYDIVTVQIALTQRTS